MTKLIRNFFTKDLKKCRLIQSYLHGTKLQSWGNRTSLLNILHAVQVHYSFHIMIVLNRNFLVNRFVSYFVCLFQMLFFLFRCRGSHELGFRTHGRFRYDTIAFSLETKFTDPNVHSMTVPLVFSLQISLNPLAFQEAVLQGQLMRTLWR